MIQESSNNKLTKVDYDKLINLVDRTINHNDLQLQCCKLFKERNHEIQYYETSLSYYVELKHKLESLSYEV